MHNVWPTNHSIRASARRRKFDLYMTMPTRAIQCSHGYDEVCDRSLVLGRFCFQWLSWPRSEFNNSEFKKLCDDNKIEIHICPFSSSNSRKSKQDNKSDVIPGYLESTNSKTVINVLPSILKAYNTSYHSTIGMSPTEALDKKNQRAVLHSIVQKSRVINRPKIEVGDLSLFGFVSNPRPSTKNIKSSSSNRFIRLMTSLGYIKNELVRFLLFRDITLSIEYLIKLFLTGHIFGTTQRALGA